MRAPAASWWESFSKEEIAELRTHGDWRGWLMLLTDYGMIAAAMAIVLWFPSVFSVAFALFVIGTRQLGLAVVLHEAAHQTLFNNRK